MKRKMTPAAFAHGFGLAAFVIGVLLMALYWGSKALRAFGGPDLAVPEALRDSAMGLVVSGLILSIVLQSRGSAENKN